jgi:predicted KAP-like P-loop ATPase
MWPDNETEKDFLNFTGVSDTVAEIIIQASGRPISIGVSGAWGVGKSSMIKLIRSALETRAGGEKSKLVFVEFNAWLYQGYDDARAALLDVIAEKLQTEAKARQTAVDKVFEFGKRIRWLRAIKLGVINLGPMALGLPPAGLAGAALDLGQKALAGAVGQSDVSSLQEKASEAGSAASDLLKPPPDTSPPREIHAIRDNFEEILEEMGVTLVVLIDDLDRCLPPTTISTLEAIRLFLFLKNTAFVIAADDAMIKHAVKKHFDGVDDALVTSYFDKLIQVPIRVPPLGTQEVRAYLMLLFTENSTLSWPEKENIRTKVCAQLGQTWRGKRVDRAFMETLHGNYPPDLLARFESADRLAPLMTSATQIAGNPRLIKRFLNALSIRMAIARAHGVTIDEAALAKMLLFERCALPAAYGELSQAVIADNDGKPRFLADWEDKANSGQELELKAPWDDQFVREWLTVTPRLANQDLRGILYVSREHSPLITAEDRLSSRAAELLAALLNHADVADTLLPQLGEIQRPELVIMMDRVLARAQTEQSWGTPDILNSCLVLAKADPSQGRRLEAFLRDRPLSQITPSIVPRIKDEPWTAALFEFWSKNSVESTVKKAITTAGKKKDGDLKI